MLLWLWTFLSPSSPVNEPQLPRHCISLLASNSLRIPLLLPLFLFCPINFAETDRGGAWSFLAHCPLSIHSGDINSSLLLNYWIIYIIILNMQSLQLHSRRHTSPYTYAKGHHHLQEMHRCSMNLCAGSMIHVYWDSAQLLVSIWQPRRCVSVRGHAPAPARLSNRGKRDCLHADAQNTCASHAGKYDPSHGCTRIGTPMWMRSTSGWN